MQISIKHHLEAQALLAVRWAEYNQEKRDRAVPGLNVRLDDDSEIAYQIQAGDPLPDGLREGNFIYGKLVPMTDSEGIEETGGGVLPIYYSTGS